MDRRAFFALMGGATGLTVATRCGFTDFPPGVQDPPREDDEESAPFDPESWSSVREQFAVADSPIDLSALLLASHPRPVRRAIEEHRRGLDREPTLYLERHNRELTRAARRAAGRHLGVGADGLALTDSTTMGLGLLYNGLRLRPDDDILTTEHDYYVTHESLRQASEGSGATIREIALYDRAEAASEQEILGRIVAALRPRTRVLALTWVHSGTGLKLPLASIAETLRGVNAQRDEDERILLCVDGVHGFGIEDATLEELGCDFFAAGTHKWIFGPRGTGVLWGRGDAWPRCRPLVPSFLDEESWSAWMLGDEPDGRPDGERMTPGGFKPFEHRWALAPAFEFLAAIGRSRIQERTHALARQLKEGLASINGVRVVTPMDERLSSGIVCCEVPGFSAQASMRALRGREIVATVTPYAVEYLRFSPSIRNTPAEVEAAIEAVRDLA